MATTTWQDKAKAKRAAVESRIPREWIIKDPPSRESQKDIAHGAYIEQFLTPQEIEITRTDAVGIVQNTSSGRWKAVDVVKAFSHTAALAHQLTNCLLEIFFEDGIKQAEELDAYWAKYRKPVGPLHGVPVSLKDQLHLKGVDTTMGYVGWIDTFQGKTGTGKERVHEAELAMELRSAGAVFYCKTTVPHTLMTPETNNNIMGFCWNSRNRLLGSGGSSGGEGTLIGAGGSPLGIGTDIGGSIRIPASVNGIFGIRPSGGRVPYEGMANSLDGQITILSVVGPLATTARSLKLVFQTIMGAKPWLHDPVVVEIPWRDDKYNDILSRGKTGELAFGILAHDGGGTPHPPVQRAMNVVVKALEKYGHSTFKWEPPVSMDKMEDIAFKTWAYDGGNDCIGAFELSGEEPVPQIWDMYRKRAPEYTGTMIANNNIDRRQEQKKYIEYWNSTAALTKDGRPADCILMPANPFAAAKPEGHRYVMYTTWVNVMDFSASVFPVLHCDKNIDKAIPNYKPLSELDEFNMNMYDAELYHGSPVALQLVGRRFEEEKMIALAEYCSQAIKDAGL